MNSTPTFEIAADGKSITCKSCGLTSYNENDVRHHYCGHCNLFHDVGASADAATEIETLKLVDSFGNFLKEKFPKAQVAVFIFNVPEDKTVPLGVAFGTNANEKLLAKVFRHYADAIENGRLGDAEWKGN